LSRQKPARSSGWVKLPIEDLASWHLDERLPSPSEQFDSLIILIGDSQPSPGERATLQAMATSARIGAAITTPPSNQGLVWLLEQQNVQYFINSGGFTNELWTPMLTMEGWTQYSQLKQKVVESKNVLMAMDFKNTELDAVVERYFIPAAEVAGFKLRTIQSGQPAGVIDDQLRVALRTSRFVVADLTDGNHGAYCEAGFAEGLGRPVIYTCSKARWEESKTHFDTNHLVTIIWDPDNPQKAADQLTATIRATLPGEASMGD
jgi:nucleoside 2-deoxyribosyltransferase